MKAMTALVGSAINMKYDFLAYSNPSPSICV